jgi:hypothetical protein
VQQHGEELMNDTPQKRFAQAVVENAHDPDPHLNPSTAKKLQAALRDALYEQLHGQPALTNEMVHVLWSAFDDLCEGVENDLLRPYGRKRGGQGKPPFLISCIAAAVAYILAARQGRIDDQSPIKTVLEVFGDSKISGLHRRTLERWVKDYGKDEIEWASQHEDPTKLTSLMNDAGKKYAREFLKATKWRRRRDSK